MLIALQISRVLPESAIDGRTSPEKIRINPGKRRVNTIRQAKKQRLGTDFSQIGSAGMDSSSVLFRQPH
ncbi:hypothetical protein EHT87_16660 [Larkinella knui]|uniref:Uncharacterized protein n=1 Tax=Larkinella knui TaxID=2025310 RepID=A0A3P1CKZ2_9BACT|nr:hypothetical protein EHT87_16660 [Larkinella knui]